MRDSVPSASYSSICNVLRQWSISLIPTYRVYRLIIFNLTFAIVFLLTNSTLCMCSYLTVGLLLLTGTNFSGFLKIVDLAGINFSDFAITCSINSKKCDESNISGYNF